MYSGNECYNATTINGDYEWDQRTILFQHHR